VDRLDANGIHRRFMAGGGRVPNDLSVIAYNNTRLRRRRGAADGRRRADGKFAKATSIDGPRCLTLEKAETLSRPAADQIDAKNSWCAEAPAFWLHDKHFVGEAGRSATR